MKRTLAIICLVLVIIVAVGGITVLAVTQKKTLLSEMKKYDERETVNNTIEIAKLNEVKSKVEEYLSINHKVDSNVSATKIEATESNSNTAKIQQEELNIEEVRDNETNQTFYRIKGQGAMVEVLKETSEIKTYINSTPPEFVVGTVYEKEKVEAVANELLQKNNLITSKEKYKMIEIKENTNFFPTVWFENKEEGKQLFITFDPESKEIANLGTKIIPTPEKNTIEISEENAKNIAKRVLKDEANVVSVELKEVLPNSMFLESGYYYSSLNIKRTAYVVTFDNKSKLQVFVDATTGEVIGGDGIW